MPKIYTKFDRPVKEYEPVDHTLIVERAGYIPAKKQVEALIYSGQRLNAYRKEEFDGDTEEAAEANADPTRDFDDLSDISALMQNLEERAATRAASSGTENRAESSSGTESVPVTEKVTG